MNASLAIHLGRMIIQTAFENHIPPKDDFEEFWDKYFAFKPDRLINPGLLSPSEQWDYAMNALHEWFGDLEKFS